LHISENYNELRRHDAPDNAATWWQRNCEWRRRESRLSTVIRRWPEQQSWRSTKFDDDKSGENSGRRQRRRQQQWPADKRSATRQRAVHTVKIASQVYSMQVTY